MISKKILARKRNNAWKRAQRPAKNRERKADKVRKMK